RLAAAAGSRRRRASKNRSPLSIFESIRLERLAAGCAPMVGRGRSALRRGSWVAGVALSLAASGDARAGGPAYTQQGAVSGAGDAFFGYAVSADGNTAL